MTGYQQRQILKIIRTIHEVTVTSSCTAQQLKNAIYQLPGSAVLKDYDVTDDNIVLKFEEDAEEKVL